MEAITVIILILVVQVGIPPEEMRIMGAIVGVPMEAVLDQAMANTIAIITITVIIAMSDGTRVRKSLNTSEYTF